MANSLFFVDSFPTNENPVILLHGLGSDHTSWVFQVDELATNGFRPIAVDVPGFGKSGYSYSRWTTRRAAMIIATQLLDGLGQPVDLISLSMGGTIAQQLIRMRPYLIKKTILASTFASLLPTSRNNLPYLTRRFRQVLAGNIAGQAETVADSIFPAYTEKEFHDYLIMQIRNSNPKIYRQAMISLAAFNSAGWMRNWTKPVLVVAGSEDSTVTLRNQMRLAAILRNKQLEVIQGAGHALSIDHKEIFNKMILNFLLEE